MDIASKTEEVLRLLTMLVALAAGDADKPAPGDALAVPAALPQNTAVWIVVEPVAAYRAVLDRRGFEGLDLLVAPPGDVPPGDLRSFPPWGEQREGIRRLLRRRLAEYEGALRLPDGFLLRMGAQVRRVHIVAADANKAIDQRARSPRAQRGGAANAQAPAAAAPADGKSAETPAPYAYVFLEGFPFDGAGRLFETIVRAWGLPPQAVESVEDGDSLRLALPAYPAGDGSRPGSGGGAGAESARGLALVACAQGLFLATDAGPVERFLVELGRRTRPSLAQPDPDGAPPLPERPNSLATRLNRMHLGNRLVAPEGEKPHALAAYMSEDYRERFARLAARLAEESGCPSIAMLERPAPSRAVDVLLDGERAGPTILSIAADGGGLKAFRPYAAESELPGALTARGPSRMTRLFDAGERPVYALALAPGGEGLRAYLEARRERFLLELDRATAAPAGDNKTGDPAASARPGASGGGGGASSRPRGAALAAVFDQGLGAAGAWLGMPAEELFSSLREIGVLIDAGSAAAPSDATPASIHSHAPDSALALRFTDHAAMRRALVALYSRPWAEVNRSVANTLSSPGEGAFAFLLDGPDNAPQALAGAGDVAVFAWSLERARSLAERLSAPDGKNDPAGPVLEQRLDLDVLSRHGRRWVAEQLAAYYTENMAVECSRRLAMGAGALASGPAPSKIVEELAAAQAAASASSAAASANPDGPSVDENASTDAAQKAAPPAPDPTPVLRRRFAEAAGGLACPLARFDGAGRDDDYGFHLPGLENPENADHAAAGERSAIVAWCRRGHAGPSPAGVNDSKLPMTMPVALLDGRVLHARVDGADQRARLNAALRAGADIDWIERLLPLADARRFAAARPPVEARDRAAATDPSGRVDKSLPVAAALAKTFDGWPADRLRLDAGPGGLRLEANGNVPALAALWRMSLAAADEHRARLGSREQCAQRLAALYPALAAQDAKDGRLPRDWSEMNVPEWTALWPENVAVDAPSGPGQFALNPRLPRALHLSAAGLAAERAAEAALAAANAEPAPQADPDESAGTPPPPAVEAPAPVVEQTPSQNLRPDPRRRRRTRFPDDPPTASTPGADAALAQTPAAGSTNTAGADGAGANKDEGAPATAQAPDANAEPAFESLEHDRRPLAWDRLNHPDDGLHILFVNGQAGFYPMDARERGRLLEALSSGEKRDLCRRLVPDGDFDDFAP